MPGYAPEMVPPTSPERPPFYKRRFVISPRFQLELTSYFLGTSLITCGGLYWGVRQILREFSLRCESLDLSELPACSRFQPGLLDRMDTISIAAGICSIIFVTLGGVFLTHRIAGPLHRLVLHLRKVAEGEKTGALTFRKGDYFQDLAESLNPLLARRNQDE